MKKFNLVIINFLIFFILILIFELVFGGWLKKNNFGYFARELRNIEVPMSVKYLDKKYNYVFKRNNLGFIGENIDPKKVKTLFLGGSTGEQMFIPTKYSVVEQLNSKFKNNNFEIKIINASKGGKSTRGYVNDFVNWFSKIENLNPEVVIFYTGLNDSTLRLPKHFDKLDKENFFGKTEDLIKNNSIIYKIKKKIENKYYNPLRTHYGLEQKYLYNNFNYINYIKAKKLFKNKIKNKENKEVLKNFNKNLENLKKIINENKINPIFITQIRYDGISDFNLFLINQTLKKFCKKNDFYIIKLDEIIKSTDKNDFYDEVHTTVTGSIKMSEYIYPYLKNIIFKNEE